MVTFMAASVIVENYAKNFIFLVDFADYLLAFVSLLASNFAPTSAHCSVVFFVSAWHLAVVVVVVVAVAVAVDVAVAVAVAVAFAFAFAFAVAFAAHPDPVHQLAIFDAVSLSVDVDHCDGVDHFDDFGVWDDSLSLRSSWHPFVPLFLAQLQVVVGGYRLVLALVVVSAPGCRHASVTRKTIC